MFNKIKGRKSFSVLARAFKFWIGDIFGHPFAKTIQSEDIEFYHRETRRVPSFFKEKKLAIQDDKLENFISSLVCKFQELMNVLVFL